MRFMKHSDFEAVMNLPIGDTYRYEELSSQQVTQLRADVQYYFQGTLKPHDNRLNDETFPHDLSWDWRITVEQTRHKWNTHLWRVVLTKVPIPLENQPRPPKEPKVK